MESTIIILLFIILIFTDVRTMLKKGIHHLNVLYISIYIITFVILILHSFNIILFSPSLIIQNIIEKLT